MKKLKRVREGKKIGVNQLGRISGVNASYISAMERGKRTNPTINTMKKLAKALDVGIEKIV